MIALDAEIVKDLSRPMDFAIIDQIVKRLISPEQVLSAQLTPDICSLSKGNPTTLVDRHPAFDLLAAATLGAFLDINLPMFSCLTLPVGKVGEDCLAESYSENCGTAGR